MSDGWTESAGAWIADMGDDGAEMDAHFEASIGARLAIDASAVRRSAA